MEQSQQGTYQEFPTLHNIFDQYTHHENRLTHALICTLSSDRKLLKPFLEWAGCKDSPPASRLKLDQQTMPGEFGQERNEEERKGIPDAVIYKPGSWLLLIESKVEARIDSAQLMRHIHTAKRRGFEDPKLLVIAVKEPASGTSQHIYHRTWRDLYRWLRPLCRTSKWARIMAHYIEVFESRMIREERELGGALTMFTGLSFDSENPYTYHEAKRLLRLMGEDLKKHEGLRKIGIDTRDGGRKAITGRDAKGVWDYIPFEIASKHTSPFTAFPHLTLVIGAEHSRAQINIPNSVKGGFKSKLKSIGKDGFIMLLLEVEKALRPVIRKSKGSNPFAQAVQRHYPSRRKIPVIDAELHADLRTLLQNRQASVKYQPEWIHSIYDILVGKRANIQFGIAVQFDYSCKVINSPSAVDLFADAWIAMQPVADLAMNSE